MSKEIINEPIVYVEENGVLKYDRLKGLKARIEFEIEDLNLDNIEATEENKALLKETRTKFSKDFKELEEERKRIKAIIEEPYKKFLEVYNEEVAVFKNVDALLKDKVDTIEDRQREEKREELEQFFNDLKVLYNKDLGTIINLNFLEFESLNLNITVSASLNKLKEEIESKLIQLKNDLLVVRSHELKARLFVIYKDKYNLSQALMELNRQLEEENKILEQAPKVEIKEPIKEPEKVEETTKIEEIVMVKFAIEDTKTNIKKVVDFMRDNNIVYKAIK